MLTPKQDDYIEMMSELNYQQWKAREVLKGIPEYVDYNLISIMQDGYEPMTGLDMEEIYDAEERAKDLFWMLPYEIKEAIAKETKDIHWGKKCFDFLIQYVKDTFKQRGAQVDYWWGKCRKLVALKREADIFHLNEEAIDLVVDDLRYDEGYWDGEYDYSDETIKAKIKFFEEKSKMFKRSLDEWKEREKHISDVTPEQK